MNDGIKWLQCPVCKETISWEIPKEGLKDVKRYPVPIVIRHDDHHLICYVDSHLQLADTEIAIGFVEGTSEK